MNDEEINEIIARNDREVEIYRDMDIQRIRDHKNAWQLSGRHGPPPQPLIQLEELPECYRNDEFFDLKDIDEEMEGRGHRKRTVVSYNDGMDDDTWAMVRIPFSTNSPSLKYKLPFFVKALEADEDIHDVMEKSREKFQRRTVNKLIREDGPSSRNSPAVDEGRARKKKGRPLKGSIDEYDASPILNGKRKRVPKAASVTPSVVDDDDDSRDSVCHIFLHRVSKGRVNEFVTHRNVAK